MVERRGLLIVLVVVVVLGLLIGKAIEDDIFSRRNDPALLIQQTKRPRFD
jgi:hypothetical protein